MKKNINIFKIVKIIHHFHHFVIFFTRLMHADG